RINGAEEEAQDSLTDGPDPGQRFRGIPVRILVDQILEQGGQEAPAVPAPFALPGRPAVQELRDLVGVDVQLGAESPTRRQPDEPPAPEKQERLPQHAAGQGMMPIGRVTGALAAKEVGPVLKAAEMLFELAKDLLDQQGGARHAQNSISGKA